MCTLDHLLENNQQWAERERARDPDYFKKLLGQQKPEYLWIGCSDSRVPANEIVDLMPGELFVHRNVANVVVHTDHNCLSVMQYAVEVLKVKHIMVVGHYGCGGVQAVLDEARFGLIDNWLRHVADVKEKHQSIIDNIAVQKQCDALCELNVIDQVRNVCQTNIVQDAWRRGQNLTIHGWVYGLADGLLHELNARAAKPEQIADQYALAIAQVKDRYAE
ncbi:carbonate dehydratase [Pseudoalteromonas citrea]|uniref:Carbonic anhydrase n=1 Tax=Pseudoalteromonas citrea TaxID=43655 RepID=A0A5S3XMU9_9GAMM|nr:carbonate dehydratase [Pseudoalteromonas citrea]TMP44105.1 carbonate dehydratase [Pseudoalteromonas citrea]TMP55676.1 carbonate dehydratase [Pseudoalteromonas citrea]